MATKLTREGFEKLKADLNRLKTVKRKEIIHAVKEARAHGDLSENAEYDVAKEEQYKLERRITELETQLSHVEIIDNEAMGTDRAYLGARLTLEELAAARTVSYVLVSKEEADLAKGKISIDSPVGRALLGKKVGEVVAVTLPRGTIQYKITKIER
ncbi:MAG: transcription elongation factor GreA [Candidatus Omnitrophica bacterium]|nr:transcription elongation factor GreA [Candidatus Omnitrophota bacterium]